MTPPQHAAAAASQWLGAAYAVGTAPAGRVKAARMAAGGGSLWVLADESAAGELTRRLVGQVEDGWTELAVSALRETANVVGTAFGNAAGLDVGPPEVAADAPTAAFSLEAAGAPTLWVAGP